jgi:hypothetical protein
VASVAGRPPLSLLEWTVGDLAHPVSRWRFLLDVHAAGTTLAHTVTAHGGTSPVSDLLAEHPETAEVIIQEHLVVLRARWWCRSAGSSHSPG